MDRGAVLSGSMRGTGQGRDARIGRIARSAQVALALLCLALAAACATATPAAPAANTLSQAERDAGWQLLFDGRTLDGWRAN